jgi:hypothetical protein
MAEKCIGRFGKYPVFVQVLLLTHLSSNLSHRLAVLPNGWATVVAQFRFGPTGRKVCFTHIVFGGLPETSPSRLMVKGASP